MKYMTVEILVHEEGRGGERKENEGREWEGRGRGERVGIKREA